MIRFLLQAAIERLYWQRGPYDDQAQTVFRLRWWMRREWA